MFVFESQFLLMRYHPFKSPGQPSPQVQFEVKAHSQTLVLHYLVPARNYRYTFVDFEILDQNATNCSHG